MLFNKMTYSSQYRLRWYLADIVAAIHLLYIFSIVYLGIFGPIDKVWISWVFITLVYLNWFMADSDCIFTVIESRLRGWSDTPVFTQRLICELGGPWTSVETIRSFYNTLYFIVAIVSLYRYFTYVGK